MRKYWMVGALVVVLAAAIGGGYVGREPYAYARMATGFAAKQTCSCLHVSGRSLASCMGDLPLAARGRFVITPTAERVRASVLFGAVHAEAQYEEGYGCRLLD